MFVEWARHGTHTALEIFREARALPALKHAVRAAPRDWWQNAAEQEGYGYPALRTTKRFNGEIWRVGYDVPAWEIIVQPLGAATAYNYHEQAFRRAMVANGAERISITLCYPRFVFSLAAREWGLNCVACDQIEKHDRWNEAAMCRRCTRRSKRFKSEAHFAIHLIETKAREMARAKRERNAA